MIFAFLHSFTLPCPARTTSQPRDSKTERFFSQQETTDYVTVHEYVEEITVVDANRDATARPATLEAAIPALARPDGKSHATQYAHGHEQPRRRLGSLRAEIAAAHSGDTIAFAYGLRGQTITLTTGELDITTSLKIDGPGATFLSVSGGGSSRVFEVGQNATVSISSLTITGGLRSVPTGVESSPR